MFADPNFLYRAIISANGLFLINVYNLTNLLAANLAAILITMPTYRAEGMTNSQNIGVVLANLGLTRAPVGATHNCNGDLHLYAVHPRPLGRNDIGALCPIANTGSPAPPWAQLKRKASNISEMRFTRAPLGATYDSDGALLDWAVHPRPLGRNSFVKCMI